METACDGCLGSRSCWVCLGTGNANTLRRLGICSSCQGTTRCAYCDPNAQPKAHLDDDVTRAELERVMVESVIDIRDTGDLAPSLAPLVPPRLVKPDRAEPA